MRSPNAVVPVDIEKPSSEFFRESEEMFKKVERTSSKYRRLIDQNRRDTRDFGFPYLNSDRCAQAWVTIYDEVRETIEWIGDAKLRHIYALWTEIHAHRETGMLENINGYCMRYPFSHGVFLLGVRHRKAIVEKIQKQPGIAAPGVSWNLESFSD
jgi:hypothetical protein